MNISSLFLGSSATLLARNLFNIIFMVRFHAEATVRRGVLFALHAISTTVKPWLLCTHFTTELQESVAWLSELRKYSFCFSLFSPYIFA